MRRRARPNVAVALSLDRLEEGPRWAPCGAPDSVDARSRSGSALVAGRAPLSVARAFRLHVAPVSAAVRLALVGVLQHRRLLGRAPGPSSLAARLRPPSIVPRPRPLICGVFVWEVTFLGIPFYISYISLHIGRLMCRASNRA